MLYLRAVEVLYNLKQITDEATTHKHTVERFVICAAGCWAVSRWCAFKPSKVYYFYCFPYMCARCGPGSVILEMWRLVLPYYEGTVIQHSNSLIVPFTGLTNR